MRLLGVTLAVQHNSVKNQEERNSTLYTNIFSGMVSNGNLRFLETVKMDNFQEKQNEVIWIQ